ncbi:helix-turn-helix domain-containing protein [Sphingosinicella sp. CPCC 101087]|uniref:AraC family transcriptional regulator n=1 Tax=Sphingosinicella sp. CPCC 101087 TaxID=2497754 RepID=UPI001980F841|nr:helix-turn-helix transcriptional regulator [Sphingosinicella sp. CPCC 101087]
MTASPSAHSGPAPTDGPVAIRTTYPPHFRSEWHAIDLGQLIYPSRGVMTLHIRSGAWVVPPLRGCWVPAHEEHRVETRTGLEMHSVYCRRLAGLMPNASGIVPISPFLRELILTMTDFADDHPGATIGEKIDSLLLGEISPQPQPPLALPEPSDPALVRIADALRADPSDARQLQDWARELGTTTRSLARAFARESRMPFTEFRRQVRLHAAMERLARGEAVTNVALDVGFSSTSNFIAMFRRATGLTPKAYFGRSRRPKG